MFQNEILSPRDSASSRVQDEANYVLIFKLLLRMLKQFKCHLVQRMQLIRTAWAVSLTTSDDGGGRDIYIYPAKNKCPYHCTILPVVTACYVFRLQQASSQIMPSFLTTQNTTKDNCSILHAQTATVSTSAYCIYFSLLYLLQPTVSTSAYCIYFSLLYLLQPNVSTSAYCIFKWKILFASLFTNKGRATFSRATAKVNYKLIRHYQNVLGKYKDKHV